MQGAWWFVELTTLTQPAGQAPFLLTYIHTWSCEPRPPHTTLKFQNERRLLLTGATHAGPQREAGLHCAGGWHTLEPFRAPIFSYQPQHDTHQLKQRLGCTSKRRASSVFSLIRYAPSHVKGQNTSYCPSASKGKGDCGEGGGGRVQFVWFQRAAPLHMHTSTHHHKARRRQ